MQVKNALNWKIFVFLLCDINQQYQRVLDTRSNTRYGYDEDSFPVAAKISNGSISLPVGPHIDRDDARYIAVKVKEVIREMNRGS